MVCLQLQQNFRIDKGAIPIEILVREPKETKKEGGTQEVQTYRPGEGDQKHEALL